VVPWVDAVLACGLLGPWDGGQRQQLQGILGTTCDTLEGDTVGSYAAPPPPAAAAAASTPGRSITFASLQEDVEYQLLLLGEEQDEEVGLEGGAPAAAAAGLATGGLGDTQQAGDSLGSSSSGWQANCPPADAFGPLQANCPLADASGPLQPNWAASAVLASLQANCGPAAGAAQGLQANLLGVLGGPMSLWGALGGDTVDRSLVDSDAGDSSAAVQGNDWPAAWLAATSAPDDGALAATSAAAAAVFIDDVYSSAGGAFQQPQGVWLLQEVQPHVVDGAGQPLSLWSLQQQEPEGTAEPSTAAGGTLAAAGIGDQHQDALLEMQLQLHASLPAVQCLQSQEQTQQQEGRNPSDLATQAPPTVRTPLARSSLTPISTSSSSSWVAQLWELLYADQEAATLPVTSFLKQQLTDAAGGRPWEAGAAERVGHLDPAAFLAMLKQAPQAIPAVEVPGDAGEGEDEQEEEEWWQEELEQQQREQQLGQEEVQVEAEQGLDLPGGYVLPAPTAAGSDAPAQSADDEEDLADMELYLPASLSPTAGEATMSPALQAAPAAKAQASIAPGTCMPAAAAAAVPDGTAAVTVPDKAASAAAASAGSVAQSLLPPAAAPAVSMAVVTASSSSVTAAVSSLLAAAAAGGGGGSAGAVGPNVTRQDLLLLRAALGQLLQVAATALQGPAEQLLRAGLCCHQGGSSSTSSSAAGTGAVVLPAAAWHPSKEAADALQVGDGPGRKTCMRLIQAAIDVIPGRSR
jgi:hypothetical protein